MNLKGTSLKKVLIVSSVFFIYAIPSVSSLTIDLHDYWKMFKSTFGKTYATQRQEQQHKQVFEKNVALIIKHNLQENMQKHSFTLGINTMSDMSNEELKHYLSDSSNSLAQNKSKFLLSAANAAKRLSLDYRLKGWVTRINDQRTCHAGYAFAVAGALEAQLKNITGSLLSLSAQNIIDCSAADGNKGCKGGTPKIAYKQVFFSEGLVEAKNYPYKGKEGHCYMKPESTITMFGTYKTIAPGDEDSMYAAINNIGPMSVGINSGLQTFVNYKDGVYMDSNCNKTIDHYVLIVGYGVEFGMQYWIVKNSWGKKWGDGGYIKIRLGQNICGIAEDVSYPVLTPPETRN